MSSDPPAASAITPEKLIATISAAFDHMDSAGGDNCGMPECPWCHSQGTSDLEHTGDCELIAAREAVEQLRAALLSSDRAVKELDAAEEMVPHAFNSRTRYEPGDDRDIWCADCEYHRDHEIHKAAEGAISSPASQSLQEIQRREGVGAAEAMRIQAQCRVCGGSGFVAQKQFVGDGYGEVDSCPACEPSRAEVSSPATPQATCQGETCVCSICTRHEWFEAFCKERDLNRAAASPATPALDVFQRIFHVANLALGEPPATRMADTGALVEIAMLAEQALKAQR